MGSYICECGRLSGWVPRCYICAEQDRWWDEARRKVDVVPVERVRPVVRKPAAPNPPSPENVG